MQLFLNNERLSYTFEISCYICVLRNVATQRNSVTFIVIFFRANS